MLAVTIRVRHFFCATQTEFANQHNGTQENEIPTDSFISWNQLLPFHYSVQHYCVVSNCPVPIPTALEQQGYGLSANGLLLQFLCFHYILMI